MITRVKINQAAIAQGATQRRRCGLVFSTTPIYIQGEVPSAIALDPFLCCEEASATLVKAAGAVVVSVDDSLGRKCPPSSNKENRVAELDDRVAELEAQLSAKDGRVAELEAQLSAKDGRVAELEAQLATNNRQVAVALAAEPEAKRRAVR